jgi:hypothetical protein
MSGQTPEAPDTALPLQQANEALPAAQDGQQQGAEEDGGAEAAFFAPPQRPADYQLPSHTAQQQGLQVDFAAEAELRTALHAAGVDNNLAASLYTVAMGAAKQDLNPVAAEAQCINTERALRQAWGGDFDANLKAANEEGRRLFSALPVSVRGDMSYAEFARVSGMANNKPIVEQLLMRAQSRSRTSKGVR